MKGIRLSRQLAASLSAESLRPPSRAAAVLAVWPHLVPVALPPREHTYHRRMVVWRVVMTELRPTGTAFVPR